LFSGIKQIGLYAASACAMLCTLAGPMAAQAAGPSAYSDTQEILKTFPKDTGVVSHGAKVRLSSGAWLDVTDNPFGKAAPQLCWYAPSLHVAGICQGAAGVNVTVLIDLRTGQRVSAPGLASLMPEAGLIAVGPDTARGIESDSVTLIKVEANELVDQGGAQFDTDTGPGAWVDGDCYRLTAKSPAGGGWLEKTPAGWRQVATAQSSVCQGRHAR
jgi:hypothetical protein